MSHSTLKCWGICQQRGSASRRAGLLHVCADKVALGAFVGCIWHHGQGAITRQVVWVMLSFSAVWWRQNLREAFGGVWVAVSTAGVVAPLWTQ